MRAKLKIWRGQELQFSVSFYRSRVNAWSNSFGAQVTRSDLGTYITEWSDELGGYKHRQHVSVSCHVNLWVCGVEASVSWYSAEE